MLTNQRKEIEALRLSAAVASGQVSGDPIYRLFEKVAGKYAVTGDILDFGAGKGELASRMQKLFSITTITCIDMLKAPTGIPSSIRWDTADLNEKTSYEDRSFNVIMAAEVIEHLENPRATMREWFRLLKPGGYVIFSTPNNQSVRSILALAFRGHFQAFGDESYPAHITALLQKDIQRIAKEAGLELLDFHYTNHGIIPKTRLSWQSLTGGLLGGKMFSDNVLAVCKKPR